MAPDEFPSRYNAKMVVFTEEGTTPYAPASPLSGSSILSLSGGSLIFTGSDGTITSLAVA